VAAGWLLTKQGRICRRNAGRKQEQSRRKAGDKQEEEPEDHSPCASALKPAVPTDNVRSYRRSSPIMVIERTLGWSGPNGEN